MQCIRLKLFVLTAVSQRLGMKLKTAGANLKRCLMQHRTNNPRSGKRFHATSVITSETSIRSHWMPHLINHISLKMPCLFFFLFKLWFHFYDLNSYSKHLISTGVGANRSSIKPATPTHKYYYNSYLLGPGSPGLVSRMKADIDSGRQNYKTYLKNTKSHLTWQSERCCPNRWLTWGFGAAPLRGLSADWLALGPAGNAARWLAVHGRKLYFKEDALYN